VKKVRIAEIEPRKEQPRHKFDEEALLQLAESIRANGVIQPILVRKQPNGFYQIIAGERRWRAAKMCGLATIPAIVRTYETQTAAEIALIENLQREDLNPIEEAEGYQYLIDRFNLTQEQVGEKVGKSRPAIANSLRLLSLSGNLIDMVRKGLISSGHARALLAVEGETQRQEFAEKIIKEQMSVRDLEKVVSEKKKPGKKSNKKEEPIPEILDLEKKLSEKIGAKVTIKSGKKKGKIEIEYYGNDDLNRLLEIFGRKNGF
jgi:ParB family chromosome partitioning protein